jgi:hypothetical protein
MAGGCACGAIRYEVTTLPLMLYVCHCTECRRQSTAAFGMSMPVAKDGFRVTQGEPSYWERRADSGRIVTAAFCSNCGMRVFHLPTRNRGIVNVKPGTLDDTTWLRPVAHLWTRSKQPWVVVPDDVLQFEKQPSDFAAIHEAWLKLIQTEV